MRHSYRILVASGIQPHGHKAYKIAVPWQIAEALSDDVIFAPPVLTADGLLFRPLPEDPPVVDVPDWARPAEREQGNGSSSVGDALKGERA